MPLCCLHASQRERERESGLTSRTGRHRLYICMKKHQVACLDTTVGVFGWVSCMAERRTFWNRCVMLLFASGADI